MGGKINLVEPPDRLVITNLSSFIPQSVEWMLEHQSPPEHYRNQWLIDGMIRLRTIEGRSPKFFISAKVADAVGQKARYIHNRGFDDGCYRRLVLNYLGRYGQAARADLDALLLSTLPDVLDAQMRRKSVTVIRR